jgi:hypothetical protein
LPQFHAGRAVASVETPPLRAARIKLYRGGVEIIDELSECRGSTRESDDHCNEAVPKTIGIHKVFLSEKPA